ncbi:error-prone DNA polymerase [Galbitalea sp. SE-J8]|uniref:error-prone DNA polymerase n=1 Tax=Galbitalea sp. SE-J8 TaxID=3054952 RepID=UPI00259CF325|nr:error-prone DNA polymerase [Galbitalea sp. SE-J8]MDM4763158.1 error-prone DNA polymerase [Galbitalea sp. SE-J8]
MGWNNPPVTWGEFERTLSGSGNRGSRPRPVPEDSDGGDGPAFSHKRPAYVAERIEPPADAVPYAELHAHSAYSFLDGASMPERLLEEAARLGLTGLALTDHDGFYGIARMAEAAERHESVATVFGAELSLGLTKPQNGEADPEGHHLLLLARGQDGYHALAGAITSAQLAGAEKGRPRYSLDDIAHPDLVALTGCRKGWVRSALAGRDGVWAGGDRDTAMRAAGRELDRLRELFGTVVVELYDHGDPLASTHNDALFELARQRRMPVVATGNAHYATPADADLAAALAAVRARRSLDDLDGWLPAASAAHLRSGAEMTRLFARYPGAVETTVDLAADLAFELRRARPRLPKQEVPAGHTPASWLRELTWRGAAERYGDPLPAGHRDRIAHELDVIEEKDFPGYFLIVHDIVAFARSRGILCQGRGSAASSAVCYALGITAVDAIFYGLPFERFISSIREEEPDIDVDFDSDRREEVIQWVFERYGRRNAAQVANVIQYRPKNAVRDMAKALGASPGQQDAWSKHVERGMLRTPESDIPDAVLDLAERTLSLPRHLGIHSGGMVLTERPVGEVVPIEHGRMTDRTVLQWDKDDCAWMGLVKFDLLGLGILSAMQHTLDLVADHLGERWELATIPKEEPGVYDQLCRADSIGVFQVESRAQMGLLPRLRPRRFYDLVIQIAMVRPGPIQGGAVHPFVRRKLGEEEITYAHPKLEPVLERTLGVPIFQEQLMHMAVAVADFSPEEADRLRRAMGSKRGIEKIASLREKLYAGMAGNGITGALADELYQRIEAFASFGFAESHALSFGLLVYASSWLRLHYPGAFLAGLLRAQPMGFYSPASLTADARRHGVETRRPDVLLSGAQAGLEAVDSSRSSADPRWSGSAAPEGVSRWSRSAAPEGISRWSGSAAPEGVSRWSRSAAPEARRVSRPPATGSPACLDPHQQPVPQEFDRDAPFSTDDHRRDANLAVRLGLADVKGIGLDVATRIVEEREASGAFLDMHDLVRRTGLDTRQLEALATADAFASMGLTRREALWLAGSAAQDRAEYLRDTVVAVQPPLFPLATTADDLVSDLWATGISPADHPIAHVRDMLDARGVLPSRMLRTTESGTRIEVGGVVTHRQRPATASGITFMNLEDEDGLVNVICSVGVWGRYRLIARDSPALIVRGILERSEEGVINLLADAFETLPITAKHRSRDFH